MKSDELDRNFDDAITRADKGLPIKGAYASGPLASDHFLLTKSWTYFRSRIAAIEKHWQDVLSARHDEKAALEEKVKVQEQRIAQLEAENAELSKFSDTVQSHTVDDLMAIKKRNDDVRISWEEERQIIENRYAELEMKYARDAARWEALHKRFGEREKEFTDNIAALHKTLMQKQQELIDSRQESLSQLGFKDDEIHRRDVRDQMFRAEIERRDQLLKEAREEFVAQRRESERIAGMLDESRSLLEARQREIEHLTNQLNVLRDEREALQKIWNQEKAEWRQLWERARESWENERARRKDNDDRANFR